MKKIIGIFFVFFALLFFLFGVEVYSITHMNDLLFNDMTCISVLTGKTLPPEKAHTREYIVTAEESIENMRYIQNTYDVYISKYIRKNQTDMAIYTTDVLLNGKISMDDGHVPEIYSGNYISNMASDESKQVGIFKCFNKKEKISIFQIEDLRSIGGFGGLLYINTTDQQKINEIVSYLAEHEGIVEIFEIYSTKDFVRLLVNSIQDSLPLAILLLICGILFVFVIIRYAISRSKEIAIMTIHGYSVMKAVRPCLIEIAQVIICSLILTTIFVFLIISIRFDGFFASVFILANTGFHAVLLVISFVLMCISVFIQNRMYNKLKMVNGKKPFALVMTLQLLIKYIVLIFALISLRMIQVEKLELERQLNANDVWMQTENIYMVRTKYVTDDDLLIRELEIKAVGLYEDFEEHLDGFMIRAGNYDKLQNGYYIYEANTSGGVSVYSPSGKSIKVNTNYLKRHPVFTETNEMASDNIVYDPYVMNILVPSSLQQYEREIEQQFLEGFAF